MLIKIDKSERVAIFIHPEYRAMLNEIAMENQRGQRDAIEHLIKKEHKKLAKTK